MGILNKQVKLTFTFEDWLVQTGFELSTSWIDAVGYQIRYQIQVRACHGIITVFPKGQATWNVKVWKYTGKVIFKADLNAKESMKVITYYLNRRVWRKAPPKQFQKWCSAI